VTPLAREVQYVQNPALGAVLIWRFSCGYFQAHPSRDSAALVLAYLVLPILFHEASRQVVRSTQTGSGLRTAVTKFEENQNPRQDVLLAVQTRAEVFRTLTTKSLGIAVSKSLVSIDTSARLVPLSLTAATAGVPGEARQLMRDAEKLGRWCALLTLHEISNLLKVRF